MNHPTDEDLSVGTPVSYTHLDVYKRQARQGLTDAAIEALVAERSLAKKQRNFARADEIRKELGEKGVVIEDSKDGVRWKRK